MDRRAVRSEPADRTGDFDLLDPVGAANRDAAAFEEIGVGGWVEEEVVQFPIQLAVG
jgi:hypothetical protein